MSQNDECGMTNGGSEPASKRGSHVAPKAVRARYECTKCGRVMTAFIVHVTATRICNCNACGPVMHWYREEPADRSVRRPVPGPKAVRGNQWGRGFGA